MNLFITDYSSPCVNGFANFLHELIFTKIGQVLVVIYSPRRIVHLNVQSRAASATTSAASVHRHDNSMESTASCRIRS